LQMRGRSLRVQLQLRTELLSLEAQKVAPVELQSKGLSDYVKSEGCQRYIAPRTLGWLLKACLWKFMCVCGERERERKREAGGVDGFCHRRGLALDAVVPSWLWTSACTGV
jgi:hypothetical protein